MERRRIVRSVKNIEEEGAAISSASHILVDDLSSWLNIGSPPSPAVMVSELREMGHSASLTHYGKPSFRTDANWDDIVEVAMKLQPPI
jgi:tRNA G26 N,N-dimethylase Trm1